MPLRPAAGKRLSTLKKRVSHQAARAHRIAPLIGKRQGTSASQRVSLRPRSTLSKKTAAREGRALNFSASAAVEIIFRAPTPSTRCCPHRQGHKGEEAPGQVRPARRRAVD